MRTHNHGYPRIGSQRELKHACEKYWAGKISEQELLGIGHDIKLENWKTQQNAGIDLIPCCDFSFYDHVLDHIVAFGVIPKRYIPLSGKLSPVDLYFALSRGYQSEVMDITAMEMTKWFDTNYHYIVPEFEEDQNFYLSPEFFVNNFVEAKKAGVENPKPVVLGPLTFLKLGKPKGRVFDTISLLHSLLPLYIELVGNLSNEGARYVQIDEPFLCSTLELHEQKLYRYALSELFNAFPDVHFILGTYFGAIGSNLGFLPQNVSYTLHVDLDRSPSQLAEVCGSISQNVILSLGIINGRNIWKNSFGKSVDLIHAAINNLGVERIMLAPSCSLIHCPCDLDLEKPNRKLTLEIIKRLAFAKQKLDELKFLAEFVEKEGDKEIEVTGNAQFNSPVFNDQKEIKGKSEQFEVNEYLRKPSFENRKLVQRQTLNLPLFPTTTIGSFPQTTYIRELRAKHKKGLITPEQYQQEIGRAINDSIKWQEEVGIDVLVHGEFERNDMVEYFGEKLDGFAFTQNGWVQSYGSRCVKPPIIFGDVSRPVPMTLEWTVYAQSLTKKPVKGMLTGPITILQWSFVREDQPRYVTAMQIALAIQEEVHDLEDAGIKIIQVDEPAIREGLPLRKADWPLYLDWAVKAFRLSVFGVNPGTQIHTHMCYSEFNDIIEAIASMDADVITIESSRSQMEILDTFANYRYPNDIGPGIYDIHSLRVPSVEEMVGLLEKAVKVIPYQQLWVNPDCGLKTRSWDETRTAVENMVKAAKTMRKTYMKWETR